MSSISFNSHKRRKLYILLAHATQLVDELAEDMLLDPGSWQRPVMPRHNFSMCLTAHPGHGAGCYSIMNGFKSWVYAHEDAQVMVASVLVVVGVWWAVRALLHLLINLVCPLLVVLLAVVCVPQLRTPLLGQNYPAVANLLRNILMKMAENVNPQ